MLFQKHKRALMGAQNSFQMFGPTSRTVAFAEGDGGGDGGDGGGGDGGDGGGGAGGDGGGADKTFTQADLNRLLANERRSNEQKLAALQTSADKVAGLEDDLKQIKDANELRDAGEAEKATILAQRAAEQNQAKTDELNATIATLEADKVTSAQKLTDFQTRTTLARELATAGLLPQSAKHAIPAMMAETEVTHTEAGDIATIKLDGVVQADVAAAAAQFLTNYPHFKAAPAGGSGTRLPNAGGLSPDKPLHEQSQNNLWAEANQPK